MGIVANQPMVLAGCLDINASVKGGAICTFLRCLQYSHYHVCRRARIHARYSPGIRWHYQARGQTIVCPYAECTVPKITLITRKAYGGAYDVMASKHLRGDVNLAWPSAEIAVMGPKGAVEIIFREEAKDANKLEQKTEQYRQKFANPFVAGRRGYIDDVIFPRDTRKRICRSLAMLSEKSLQNPDKKHGNIPL